MVLLIKLLLAHLLGDFILQPGSWVEKKQEKKLRSWQLYVHTLIHGALIMLLVWDIEFLIPAVLITVSHGLIDTSKLVFQEEKTKRIWFFIDQILHLVVILIVWYYAENPSLNFGIFTATDFVLLLTAVVFITNPSSIIIKTVISQWIPDSGQTNIASLQNAGKYIGVLERLFVFTFVLMNHWEGIGFLIAAKSVFRFGDLKNSADLKLTEYVLIGTLLSFGIAISAGLLLFYRLEDGIN